MPQTSFHLVFGPRFEAPQFRRFIEDLSLQHVRSVKAVLPGEHAQEVFVLPDRSAAIHYGYDTADGVFYAWVHGPNAYTLYRLFGRYFDFTDETDVLRRLRKPRSTEHRRKDVARLGLLSDTSNDEVTRVLTAHLAPRHAQAVREAAVRALAAHRLPERLQVLRDVASKDASPEVRDLARRFLEAAETLPRPA